MKQQNHTLRIHLKESESLKLDVEAFLLDCQSRNLSPGTLRFYQQKLYALAHYLTEHGITTIEDVTSNHLRAWLVNRQETDHNSGGCHGFFRAARAWFNWLFAKGSIAENPMSRIKPPRVPDDPLKPVSIDQVKAMLAVCPNGEVGARDRAAILALLDTGCRASEFVTLTCGDLNVNTGALVVRKGKGGKQRVVFLGTKARRELLRYLRFRGETDLTDPLFASKNGQGLTYGGLRDIIRRRAKDAGIETPTLHSFRRAFALMSLRNGIDVYSLQKLMGHADLSILRRYLAQTEQDLQHAHGKSSPVDNTL